MSINNSEESATSETSPILGKASDEMVEQWTQLVRHYYPTLAVPIAHALAQRAAQGPYGEPMRCITKGLAGFDERAILELTGSELQMLSALCLNLREQAHRLLQQVNMLWREP